MYINGQPCGGAFFRGERIFDANPPGLESTPFYIEDISGSANTLSIKKDSSSAPTITVEKSTDGVAWETMGTTSTTDITATIPANGKLYLRATANKWATSVSYYNTITASGRHNVGGNILSLLHGSTFTGYTRNLTSTNTYAFISLFRDDTNLVSAENLILNTTLATYCYYSMFSGCASLTTAPELPATKLALYCYQAMFNGCTSLTTAPALPATTLTNYCYAFMFRGCTSLTTAPNLPATTLANYCYGNMFYNCTSLTTAPSLPATTLAQYCYDSMFHGCTSLTTAPNLPATTLAQYCYEGMFYGCTLLNYIKCLATNISASGCLSSWVSSVAATGTFVKAVNMTSWPTGTSGIPSNWTVQDAA